MKRVSRPVFYEEGARAATCSVWYGNMGFGSPGIYYSSSEDGNQRSYNESLTVANDGYSLCLKPLGMPMYDNGAAETLSSKVRLNITGAY